MTRPVPRQVLSLLYHDVTHDAAFAVEIDGPADANSTSAPEATPLSGFATAGAAIYKLPRDNFASHLDALVAVGRRVGTVRDAERGESECLVTMTFDDGGTSAHSVIAPMLEERGWRGQFFVATDYIGADGFMTADQIRDLHDRGHVIGSHSCSHPDRMSKLDDGRLRHEWLTSVEVLADVIGERPRSASVPNGYHSKRVARAAGAAGIRWLFTSEPRHRPERADGCFVLGRYNVQAHTSAETVASLVGESSHLRRKQAVTWTAKKLVKSVGGEAYIALREMALRARRDGAAARSERALPAHLKERVFAQAVKADDRVMKRV